MCVPLWELASGRTPRHATTARYYWVWSVFHVCPVQVRTVDPSVWEWWVKPTETDTGDVQRQDLKQWSLGEGYEVKLHCQSKPFWLSADKRFESLHTIQALMRGNNQPILLARTMKQKYKNKSIFLYFFKHPPLQLGASHYMYWRMMWFWIAFKFRAVQTIEPSSPIFHQLPASPLPTCLISPSSLGKKW